ncbi:MAG TPA: hypothetical protein VJR89_38770 [Polyangiales bacterium]|nr:hypothetical protein [Polyangiales bacterium]
MRIRKRLRETYIAHVLYGASVSLLVVGSGLAQESFDDEFEGEEPEVNTPDIDPEFVEPTPGQTEPPPVEKPCVTPAEIYANDCIGKVVMRYTPRFELWSDHADKERFIYLPKLEATPSSKSHIDVADPNRWVFPEGTRLYKTFSRFVDGKLRRIETRVISKQRNDKNVLEWKMQAYRWNTAQTAAELVGDDGAFVTTDGHETVDENGKLVAAPATYQHWIPSQADCADCHLHRADKPEPILGFDAIQLADSGMLKKLIDEGRLYNSRATSSTPEKPNGITFTADDAKLLPNDSVAREALGYLHGNCGHCHGGPNPQNGLSLWSEIGLKDPLLSNAYRTGKCKKAYPTFAIDPHNAKESAIYKRMNTRAPHADPPTLQWPQMPPIATFDRHEDGLASIEAWINALPASEQTCSVTPPPR